MNCRRSSSFRAGKWTAAGPRPAGSRHERRRDQANAVRPPRPAGRRGVGLAEPHRHRCQRVAQATDHRRLAAARGGADRRGDGSGVDHARRPAAGAGGDGGVGQRAEPHDAADHRAAQRRTSGTDSRDPLDRHGSPARDPHHSWRHGSQRDRSGDTGIQGRLDPGPQGPRGGPQAPRHVHRLHRRERPAPPGLRGGGQLDRRGAGRATATRSTSRSTPTTRSPSRTTAAASRWTSTRPRRCPASRWR